MPSLQQIKIGSEQSYDDGNVAYPVGWEGLVGSRGNITGGALADGLSVTAPHREVNF